jgi:hypothetical protein
VLVLSPWLLELGPGPTNRSGLFCEAHRPPDIPTDRYGAVSYPAPLRCMLYRATARVLWYTASEDPIERIYLHRQNSTQRKFEVEKATNRVSIRVPYHFLGPVPSDRFPILLGRPVAGNLPFLTSFCKILIRAAFFIRMHPQLLRVRAFIFGKQFH